MFCISCGDDLDPDSAKIFVRDYLGTGNVTVIVTARPLCASCHKEFNTRFDNFKEKNLIGK